MDCPKTGLPLVHSGSQNYNGMLKKKHPQKKSKSSQEKKKLPQWEINQLKGRTNLLKKRWNLLKKAVIRSPLPSITYHWKFYSSGRSNMDHINLALVIRPFYRKEINRSKCRYIWVYTHKYINVCVCLVVCPKTGPTLAHSGSRNYNGIALCAIDFFFSKKRSGNKSKIKVVPVAPPGAIKFPMVCYGRKRGTDDGLLEEVLSFLEEISSSLVIHIYIYKYIYIYICVW